MALTFPYPLAFLSAHLCTTDGVQLEIMRNDEQSGSGDGRYWTAQLARPLWKATLTLAAKHAADARALNAKIWALDGTKNAFLWSDPSYSGATGGAAGTGVTVSAISTDRTRVSLTGLPASFAIAAGDRLSISYGSGRVYYGTFAEDRTASSAGAAASTAVFPYIPAGVSVGDAVEMDKPFFKAFVPPDGFTPYPVNPKYKWAEGASLTLLQRVS